MDHRPLMTRMNQAFPNVSNAEARFFARSSIAPGISLARGVKAKSAVPPTTSVSAAYETLSRAGKRRRRRTIDVNRQIKLVGDTWLPRRVS